MITKRFANIERTILLAAVLLVGLSHARPSLAAQWSTCNGKAVKRSSSVTYQPANISFPAYSSWRASLERMLAAWNYYTPGGQYRISFVYTDDSKWQSGDGKNTVAFAASGYAWGSGVLAVTLVRLNLCLWPYWDGQISETDILFNPNVTWNTSTSFGPNDLAVNLTQVGVHEFGHSMGLNHEDRWMAIMNSYYPMSGSLGGLGDPDPHADDAVGVRSLYGTAATVEDVAANTYQRTGSGTSAPLASPTLARKGGSVPITFTISNRGTVKENYVLVYLYLSTNSYISSGDTYLGSAAVWMDAGFEGPITLWVTIPTWITPGYYYLGGFLDPKNAIPETIEYNNSVAYKDQVYVY